MKLSEWAKRQGITYRTAWSWFHDNQIQDAYQSPSGTIIVNEQQSVNKQEKVVIYCRISSLIRKNDLDYQVQQCEQFCLSRGIIINKIFKEVASGMNDKRRELLKMLEYNPTTIIVEHKDKLTRFGFNYLKVLLDKMGCKIIVINEDHEDEADLIKDMISIVTSFCCRLYGLRRGKNKANKVKEIINSA